MSQCLIHVKRIFHNRCYSAEAMQDDGPAQIEQFDIVKRLIEVKKYSRFGSDIRAFGRRMGTSYGPPQKIVNGETKDPRFETVLRWIAACDMTLAEFFSAAPVEYRQVNKTHHDHLEMILNSGDSVAANAVIERLAQEWRNVRGSPLKHQGGEQNHGGATGKPSRMTSKQRRKTA